MALRILRNEVYNMTKAKAARLPRPLVVCLCGSTRFKQSWIAENARLTGEGNIVLAVGLWGHHERVFPDETTKAFLDDLHLRKIDLCDWVWVLDVGGYIGESTRQEIEYAESHRKPVRYLSKEFPEYVEPVDQLVAANERAEKAEAAIEHALRLIACDPYADIQAGKRIELLESWIQGFLKRD